MTAVRVRTPGNNPETRIHCDWTNGQGDRCRSLPVADWDAREARKRAKAHGWVRADKNDYCPVHAQETAHERFNERSET